MFIVLIDYIKPIEMIDQHLGAHRAFLGEGYQKNYFIASGPRAPRTGGIIISQLSSQTLLKDFLKNDPFKVHNLARYTLIAFDPVKYHPDFSTFIA